MVTEALPVVRWWFFDCGFTAAATSLVDRGMISMASRLSVAMPMSDSTDCSEGVVVASAEDSSDGSCGGLCACWGDVE